MKIQVTFNEGKKIIVEANSKESAKAEVRKITQVRVWRDFVILTDKKAEEIKQAEAQEFSDLFANLYHHMGATR